MIPKVGLAHLSTNIGIELWERRVKKGREKETEEGWQTVRKGEGRKKKQHKMEEVPGGKLLAKGLCTVGQLHCQHLHSFT